MIGQLQVETEKRGRKRGKVKQIEKAEDGRWKVANNGGLWVVGWKDDAQGVSALAAQPPA
jgi:hypothetical protein